MASCSLSCDVTKCFAGIDVDGVALGQQLAGQRVDLDDALDLVAEEVDADRQLLVRRVDRDAVAAHAELAADEIHVVALVLHIDEAPHDARAVELLALLHVHDEALVLLRLAKAVDAGDGGDDQHVAALEERARRGVAQLVDLLVDVGVLGDVRVGPRDVRLGLVVVVVGDEVLDRVLREEVLELGAKLRGQRPVRRQHERRPLVLRDDVRHRERLAAPGDAQQRLRAVAAREAADERVDRLRLVAGGLEVGDKLEVGHWVPSR